LLGANDVAMIQEANVGCGLLGHEGAQAAMSADYAFGQFRFLSKLLVVHGQWSYQRISDMHKNFFYKVHNVLTEVRSPTDALVWSPRTSFGHWQCFGLESSASMCQSFNESLHY
jgi:hypothetical protein